VLFVPIISQHTQERLEGYFRREWKLAIERTHDMAEQKPFLVPVVIDSTGDRDAIVPDLFRAVQWTRLPAGGTSPEFVARIKRLLTPESAQSVAVSPRRASVPIPNERATHPAPAPLKRILPLAIAGLIVLAALVYLVIEKPRLPKPETTAPLSAAVPAPAQSLPAAAFNPPPHSIAVLPFVNMSGDKEQEYFSDGLSEELLNDLARINELQVAARTSAFSFKGKDIDIGTIARKLNVGAVLEGSVRRSANTVRVTAQLINAVTGFHLWSQTYDRASGDVLKLQTELAEAVANALKVTLLGGDAAKIDIGGTRNPAAFDAYLRASKIFSGTTPDYDNKAAIAGYTEAIRLDPEYALAYAYRSFAFTGAAYGATIAAHVRVGNEKAQVDAAQAIALAPSLGEGHLALGRVYANLLQFTRAGEEYELAVTLAPGNASVLRGYGTLAAFMGSNAGLTALQRAVALDPLNSTSHERLAIGLLVLRHYAEAIAAFKETLALDPTRHESWGGIGWAYYLLDDLESARSACENKDKDDSNSIICLAITYEKMGRHADAEAMLGKIRAIQGDSGALNLSGIYAQWGNTTKALDWLETAMRLRIPDLMQLKDPLFDPLRKEPRYQAIERELKFPN
jgi:TolB-like protein